MLTVAEHFSDSDLGRQRQGNEDALYVRPPLFVVADGMGGAQAGEVASDMAVRAFERELPGRSPGEELADVIRSANRRIHERSRADRQRAGMGTTVTAAYLTEDDEVVVAHVGDSRCYLLRDGDLVRLTRDHSLVGELVARGKLTEEEAESHPQRSVITRALGPEADVDVDVDVFTARDGDVFMLCSDGLTSMLSERRVKALLDVHSPLEERGRALIAEANRAGGRDNITVVLFRLASVHPAEGSATASAVAGSSPRQQTVETGAIPALGAGVGSRGDEGPAATGGGDAPGADTDATGEADAHATRTHEATRTDEATAHAPRSGSPDGRSDGRAAAPAARPMVRRRHRWSRVFKGIGVLMLLVVPLVAAAWTASRVVYFVGVDPERNQTITIYRGVPYELPGDIRLYERFYSSGVTLDAVPPGRRDTFTDHQLRSRDDAEDLVISLERGELSE